MKVFSQKSKRFISEAGFQFENIMRQRSDPDRKEMKQILENRKNRANLKKDDNCL